MLPTFNVVCDFFAGIDGIVTAIERGENIDRKHVQSMFIGPGGSGKSSLMDRLLHRQQALYISTGVANPVVIVDIDTFYAVDVFDPNHWEEVKFNKSLVGQMHESVYSLQQVKASTNLSTKTTAIPAPNSASVSNTTAVVNLDADKAVTKQATTTTSRPPGNGKIKSVISSVVKKQGGFAKFENRLKKKFSLYLRDAGGQVEFQEMVSLLVFGPSIFFFVFRGDQDLKSTFTVGYRKSASESINCYPSSITTEEALLQCLASVYAMDTPDKASSLQNHHPYVFIVATHKDKLGPSADQKILQLNNYLKSLIKESGFANLVQYADVDAGLVLFAVDNTSESDDDFKAIRSKVHNLIVSRKEFTVKYPVAYLLFCLELQSDQHSILTLEDCRTRAAKYKIEGDQVSRHVCCLGGGIK